MFIKLTTPSGKTTLINASAIIQVYVSNDMLNPLTTLLMNKAICGIERIPVKETPEEIYEILNDHRETEERNIAPDIKRLLDSLTPEEKEAIVRSIYMRKA